MPPDKLSQFDAKPARWIANNRGWSKAEWARRAGTTRPTLQRFLDGDPTVKYMTVEQIVAPLGIHAVDILIKNPVEPVKTLERANP